MLRTTERVAQDGRAVFEPLVPGDYTLRTWGSKPTDAMRVHVAGDTQVRFAPSPITSLDVRIHNRRGLLAQQGLADGDLIIGIDGEEFTDAFALEAAMMRGMSAETVTLTVLRGWRRVQVTLDPSALKGGGDMGGDIEPAPR